MKPSLALLLCLLASPVIAETPRATALPAPLTCLLRPDRSAEIGADAGGIVAEVLVRRTSKVRKGDLLVQLDDRIAQAELAKATIAREVTDEKLRRAETLTAGRVISKEEVATLRGDAAMALADFTRAELQVERSRIVAPFDGTVAEVMTEAGQLVNVNPLLHLIATSRLRAEIIFPAEAFGQLAQGDILPLVVDLTGAQVDARVATIDNYIDASSNSLYVMAEIENPEDTIPAGTGCRIAGR